MGTPRFRTLTHTADLRVAVWGRDDEELIRNAVAAAVTIVLGHAPPGLPVQRWASVRPWPAELPSRLVRAVNEALFRLYTRRQIAVGFALTERGPRLALAPLPAACRPQVEVKAATYHDLHPHRGAGRLSALLTLDV